MKALHSIFIRPALKALLFALAPLCTTIANPPQLEPDDFSRQFTEIFHETFTDKIPPFLAKKEFEALREADVKQFDNALKNPPAPFPYKTLAPYALINDHLALSLLLFEMGSPVSALDTQENNILHIIARHIRASEIKLHLEKIDTVATTQEKSVKEMLLQKNKFGITPYHAFMTRAACCDEPEIIAALKEWLSLNSEHMRIATESKNNPIHVLAFLNTEPAEELTQNAPGLSTPNAINMIPSDIAYLCQYTEMEQYLKSKAHPHFTDNPAQDGYGATRLRFSNNQRAEPYPKNTIANAEPQPCSSSPSENLFGNYSFFANAMEDIAPNDNQVAQDNANQANQHNDNNQAAQSPGECFHCNRCNNWACESINDLVAHLKICTYDREVAWHLNEDLKKILAPHYGPACNYIRIWLKNGKFYCRETGSNSFETYEEILDHVNDALRNHPKFLAMPVLQKKLRNAS
ncbi:hypothetical protein HOD08_05380 [bacterium]|nr:hypothetical protein [bacterium]